jgi:hypothetical protein
LLPSLSRWSISFHSEEIHHVTNPTDHFSCAADDRSGPVARRRPSPCHLTMDSRLGTFLTSSSSTPSCSKDPQSSPAEPMSTPPPPLLLTVNERHPRVEAEPSSSCPARCPLDARACPAGVGAPHRPSRRWPPRRRACSACGDYRGGALTPRRRRGPTRANLAGGLSHVPEAMGQKWPNTIHGVFFFLNPLPD